jgi:hypothetical protein
MNTEDHAVTAEQVSHDTLEAICKLTLSGSTPEAISLALDLNVQTVIQVFACVLLDDAMKGSRLEGSQGLPSHKDH